MNECRDCSVIAMRDSVIYVLSAAEFLAFIKRPNDKRNPKYDEIELHKKFQNEIYTKLSQFKQLGVIGNGRFGHISLVKDPFSNQSYALKKIRKNRVYCTNREEKVRNERGILCKLHCPFIAKLYGTYSDELNVHLLMEPVLGGQLFYFLALHKTFSEHIAKFYSACIMLAFEHSNSQRIESDKCDDFT